MAASLDRRRLLQSAGTIAGGLAVSPMLRLQAPGTASAAGVLTQQTACGAFLYPEASGVIGNGSVDDTRAFGRLLERASREGRTIFIRAGLRILVQSDLYLYGNASIIGESQTDSQIILSTGPGTTPTRWVHCGLASGSTAPRLWTGKLDNITFKVKALSQHKQVIALYTAENFALTNCIVDQRELRQDACNCVTSGYVSLCTPNGASGSCLPRNGQILNNRLLGAVNGSVGEGMGGAGINLIGADALLIAGNYIEGFNDDAIAVINSTNCTIRDNRAKGIRSRIASFGGKFNSIVNNYLERQPGADGIWQPAAIFYATHLAAGPTPEQIKFLNNTAVLPAAAPDAGNTPIDFMLIGGVNGCIVSGNTFINDSQQTRRPQLRLLPFGSDPNLPGDQISRPRSVEIGDNIMGGAFPGAVEEQLGGGPSGPILYRSNIASAYNIQHPNSLRVLALTSAGEWVDSNLTI